MKVKELINLLEDKDPEALIIIQKDIEANGYTPLESIWSGVYLSGDVYLQPPLTRQEIEDGYTDEDLCPSSDGINSIILCPHD